MVDFGTATTYDLVYADGTFFTGVIQPGIGISARALTERAAKLPDIELRKPSTIISPDDSRAEQLRNLTTYLSFGLLGELSSITTPPSQTIKEIALTRLGGRLLRSNRFG